MIQANLITAFFDFDQGRVEFNHGRHRAILYGRYWYPMRAIANHARRLAEEEPDLTTNRAIKAILDLGFIMRMKWVEFNDDAPVPLSDQEVVDEVHEFTMSLERLIRRLG